jgi:hypothetical protein
MGSEKYCTKYWSAEKKKRKGRYAAARCKAGKKKICVYPFYV